MPIIQSGYSGDASFDKDLLMITGAQKEDRYDFTIIFNDELLNKINTYVSDTHFQTVSMNDFKITVIVENDSKEEKGVTACSSYICPG